MWYYTLCYLQVCKFHLEVTLQALKLSKLYLELKVFTSNLPIGSYNNCILVLENVSINSGNTKFISNSGRAIDLSKITILNSMGQHKSANAYGNIVIMSDSKVKASNPSLKGLKLS